LPYKSRNKKHYGKQIATFKDYAIFMADKTNLLEIAQFVVKENYSHNLFSFTEILSTEL